MSKPDPALRKDQLRRQARAARRRLSVTERATLDRQIGEHLLAGIMSGEASTIAGFLSFDGEPNLEPVLVRLTKEGRDIALPVIDPTQPGTMIMRSWNPKMPMQANAYGIPEPLTGNEMLPDTLDLILVPLVAYDDKGTRLGMGGGFYDRWLSGCCSENPPRRVGVAYSAQRISNLPREDWDIPLDGVVNEDGWFSFQQQGIRMDPSSTGNDLL